MFSRSKNKGFTLIEVMVVVAIIGILASIALPSYSSYVRKGKRIEAKTALMSVLQSQGKYRANCPQYASSLAAADSCILGAYTLASASVTPAVLYTLAVTAADTTSFTATASAVAGSAQSKDTGCLVLTLAQDKGNLTMTPPQCW